MELYLSRVPRQVLLHLYVIVALTLAAAAMAQAQQLDSKGRDFWVCFMANFGSDGVNETSDLRLYLSSQKATTARITYTLTGEVLTVPLPTPNVPVEVNINATFGFATELDMVSSMVDAQSGKSFHVVAEDDITLYGANIRSKSADAFLGLPLDVLTGRYIVLAYPNGYAGTFPNGGGYDMPSQFAIIATEDSTEVNITPAAVLVGRGDRSSFSIMLSKGEVFFGQATLFEFSEQDVSGTQISANKPIALFGGNRRTSIPTRVGNFRDHLVEQLPPLDAWGQRALATPHYRITPSSLDTAVVRIIAAFPGTDVTIVDAGGTRTQVVGAGVSFEVPLLRPMTITGSQPIMVAQYEHSVNVGTGSTAELGDPFMMLIPPPEQFDSAYAFQSIIHPEFRDAHYINVVIPPNGLARLRLDNQTINQQFNPIPGSNFVYAQIPVTEGSHFISSDQPFGLYVYGFGAANSYGYPGGMLFKRLVRDFESPEMLVQVACGSGEGFTYDSKITDTGIDSCVAMSDTQNVKLVIDPFKPGTDTVRFSATLIDPYRDGVIAIRSVDREGHVRTQSKSIPGFTLRFAGSNDAPATLDTFVAVNAQDFCRKVELKNYGKFDQRVTGMALSDSFKRHVDPMQFPLTIPAGGTASVEICFETLPDTVFTTTLTLIGDCGTRDVAIVPVDNRIDTSAPSVGIEGSLCSDEFIVTYFERFRSSGIAAIDVDSTINCTAEKLVDPTKLPAQQVQVRLRRVDPRQDLVYQVTLYDAVGNKLIDRDTIGGFTVNLGRNGAVLGVRHDREWGIDSIDLQDSRCDTVMITNYGSRFVHLDQARVRGNLLYSIPPSQFPITIAPGDSSALVVCLEGKYEYEMMDTLLLMDGCGHIEELAMKTPVRALFGVGATDCGATLSFATYAPTKRVFLATPLPNPVAGGVHVDIGLPRADGVTLEIYSSHGNRVLDVMQGAYLPAGISRVAFDVSRLQPGAYFCRMTTAAGTVDVQKIVVQR